MDALSNLPVYSRGLGPRTWARAAPYLADPAARCYEIGRVLSASAPQSPFTEPVEIEYRGAAGLPGIVHAHHGEILSGGLTQQGTHVDALGHFGVLAEPWDGTTDYPVESVTYYGGLSAAEVRPASASGLAVLGVDTVPPLITTAVILDATAGRENRAALEAGEVITLERVRSLLAARGLGERGILAGDAVLIHTGWGERWHDPDDGTYYNCGPGLGLDAAQWLARQGVAVIGLDNPFTDPIAEGQLRGEPTLPADVRPEAPFQVHDFNLVKAGVLQIQNLFLSEIAADEVALAAFIALPLRIRGASGSPLRPILIGKRQEGE